LQIAENQNLKYCKCGRKYIKKGSKVDPDDNAIVSVVRDDAIEIIKKDLENKLNEYTK